MKLSLILCLIALPIYCQTATYSKINTAQNYTEYITKNNLSIKKGDSLTIGYPFSGSFFTFITQGGQQTSPILSNKKIAIKEIKTIGNKKIGYKTYILFTGYGWVPIYIDYESALDTGELKSSN